MSPVRLYLMVGTTSSTGTVPEGGARRWRLEPVVGRVTVCTSMEGSKGPRPRGWYGGWGSHVDLWYIEVGEKETKLSGVHTEASRGSD